MPSPMRDTETIADRLASLGLIAADLARVANVDRSTASRWLAGQTKPYRSNLETIAEHSGVSLQWLQHGAADGPPQAEPPRRTLEQYRRQHRSHVPAPPGPDYDEVAAKARKRAGVQRAGVQPRAQVAGEPSPEGMPVLALVVCDADGRPVWGYPADGSAIVRLGPPIAAYAYPGAPEGAVEGETDVSP